MISRLTKQTFLIDGILNLDLDYTNSEMISSIYLTLDTGKYPTRSLGFYYNLSKYYKLNTCRTYKAYDEWSLEFYLGDNGRIPLL